MKKLILIALLLLSFAACGNDSKPESKYMTTEKEKKEIIAKILKGDQKAKDKWYVIERNLQELMDNGNVEAEKELAKWDDLLYEAGL